MQLENRINLDILKAELKKSIRGMKFLSQRKLLDLFLFLSGLFALAGILFVLYKHFPFELLPNEIRNNISIVLSLFVLVVFCLFGGVMSFIIDVLNQDFFCRQVEGIQSFSELSGILISLRKSFLKCNYAKIKYSLADYEQLNYNYNDFVTIQTAKDMEWEHTLIIANIRTANENGNGTIIRHSFTCPVFENTKIDKEKLVLDWEGLKLYIPYVGKTEEDQ